MGGDRYSLPSFHPLRGPSCGHTIRAGYSKMTTGQMAHKLILAMASPVFEAMLFGEMAEKMQPILIPDVYPDAFQTLLQYIYTDEINLNSVDKAVDVCYAAKKYLLPQLVRECTQYIWKDMSANNVCKAYEFAKLFDVPILMEKCLQAVASSADEVLRSESISDLSIDTIRVILSLEEMNLSSELVVFNAAHRWAEREAERRDLKITGSNIREVKKLHQIASNCIKLHQIASNCINS
uniref:BTB domain-containing protein n=1 Tax=Strigamia maritima TaxID=126957 RepID=T1J816_STRMM